MRRGIRRRALVLAALALGALGTGCAEDARLIFGVEETPRERVARASRVLAESRDPTARENAVIDLGAVRTPEVVEPLSRALRDPDPRVRRKAADRLDGMRNEPAARAAVPALREVLAVERDGPTRVEMAWALRHLEGAERDWVPAFRASLGDPDPLTRYNAALGLVGRAEPVEVFPVVFAVIGTEFARHLISTSPASVVRQLAETGDRRLVPLLVQGLERGNPEQRAAAAAALARYDPAPREAVPLLTQLLRHPEAKVRDAAALALFRVSMQTPARSAAPDLATLLRDPDPGVRRSAAMALRLVDAPRVAVPALLQALGDPVPAVREEAAFALGELRAGAQDAVPALVPLLERDPQKEVRIAACRALEKLTPRAREAVPALRAALRDPDPSIRDCAATALGGIERAR